MKINKYEENILTVERCTILEILGVTNNTLKQIIRKKQLTERLREKGYILLETFKEGRKTLYRLKEFEGLSQNKFQLNNAMECIFNTTKDENKHTDYIIYRYANINRPLSKKHLSEKLGVNEKTIGKWDNHMVEYNLLAKDGYFYVAMDFNENGFEYRLTNKDEYKSFTLNNLYIKEREKAYEEYDNNKISKVRLDMIIVSTTEQIKANYGKIVYKVSKYTVGKDKDIAKLILKLIKEVYDSNLAEYILDYLPIEIKNNKTTSDYMKEL